MNWVVQDRRSKEKFIGKDKLDKLNNKKARDSALNFCNYLT